MELKTIGLTKRYGEKVAVDYMNLTLTGGGLRTIRCQRGRGNYAYAPALQGAGSFRRRDFLKW